MRLPSKFIYSEMPCLSCGDLLVLNGPAVMDAEHLHHFINGEETLVEYVCTTCPEHWGFYGARNPASLSFMDMLRELRA